MPKVLAGEVAKQLGATELDVVRTYLFGSYAVNYDVRDEKTVERRLDFFGLLKEEYHYEVETFPIDFRGRRLRRSDRDPSDTFEPKEKCVDISLATSMLYFAAIPYAYDIAIAVIGDQDFKPVLQHVRRLGKRVTIASIKGSCAAEFADPRDEARVKDFDIIWLDDLLHELELRYERHQLECQSPSHRGARKVWTTFHPRKGQRFYCDECRQAFARQKQAAQREFVSGGIEHGEETELQGPSNVGQCLSGTVTRLVEDRGYGFVRTPDGSDYFFHLTDLVAELEFSAVRVGDALDFEVKRRPAGGKAGAAQRARRSSGA